MVLGFPFQYRVGLGNVLFVPSKVLNLKKTVDKLDGMLNGHLGNLQGEYAFI